MCRVFSYTLEKKVNDTMNDTLSTPIVNSYNEWDPLEEVIIGRADNACMSDSEPAVKVLFNSDDEVAIGTASTPLLRMMQRLVGRLTGIYGNGGFRGPMDKLSKGEIEAANEQLDHLVEILEGQDVWDSFIDGIASPQERERSAWTEQRLILDPIGS